MSDIATKQTQIATAINVASTANSLFERLKQAADAKKHAAKPAKEDLPPNVEQMIQKAHGLINDHQGWIIEFEAPSDRALWSLLGKVKGLCDEITAMPVTEQDKVKEAFRNQINARTSKPTVNANTSLVTLVVKFIFKDSPRQTVYNYRRSIEIATEAGVTAEKFASYVDAKKGIINMVESSALPAGVISSAETLTERITSMRQIITLGSTEAQEIEFHGEVMECFTPAKDSKDGKPAKPNPKKTPGKFVFWMSVPTEVEGKYKTIRGHIFDQSFEDALIGQILQSPLMKDVDAEILKAQLDELKQASGFDGMRESIE